MKPAFSVIFLTTLIGAAQGLFLALFTHQSYALFGLLPMQSDDYYGYGSALALVFLGGGLHSVMNRRARGLLDLLASSAPNSISDWYLSSLTKRALANPIRMRHDPIKMKEGPCASKT